MKIKVWEWKYQPYLLSVGNISHCLLLTDCWNILAISFFITKIILVMIDHHLARDVSPCPPPRPHCSPSSHPVPISKSSSSSTLYFSPPTTFMHYWRFQTNKKEFFMYQPTVKTKWAPSWGYSKGTLFWKVFPSSRHKKKILIWSPSSLI